MNDETNLKVLRLVMFAIVIVWVVTVASCQATKYQVRKAIEFGAKPAEARCAIMSSQSEVYCLANAHDQ